MLKTEIRDLIDPKIKKKLKKMVKDVKRKVVKIPEKYSNGN